MTTYFTSDWHFHHKNIIKYCDRPFDSIHKMDAAIIDKYNSCVTNDDTCFVLGDIGMATAETLGSLIKRLNGKKHLILGNHDGYKAEAYINMGFESVHTSFILTPCSLWPDIDREWLLGHDPVLQICVDLPMLCGHVHQISDMVGKAMNVGVDVCKFYPAPYGDVTYNYALRMEKSKALKING